MNPQIFQLPPSRTSWEFQIFKKKDWTSPETLATLVISSFLFPLGIPVLAFHCFPDLLFIFQFLPWIHCCCCRQNRLRKQIRQHHRGQNAGPGGWNINAMTWCFRPLMFQRNFPVCVDVGSNLITYLLYTVYRCKSIYLPCLCMPVSSYHGCFTARLVCAWHARGMSSRYFAMNSCFWSWPGKCWRTVFFLWKKVPPCFHCCFQTSKLEAFCLLKFFERNLPNSSKCSQRHLVHHTFYGCLVVNFDDLFSTKKTSGANSVAGRRRAPSTS